MDDRGLDRRVYAWLQVNPASGVPVYLQVVERFKAAITAGVLAPGERLPSVRELAARLMVNPNTAARAYQELERLGLVVSQAGRGTHVGATASPLPEAERRRRLEEAVDRLFVEGRALGFSDQDIARAAAARSRAAVEPARAPAAPTRERG